MGNILGVRILCSRLHPVPAKAEAALKNTRKDHRELSRITTLLGVITSAVGTVSGVPALYEFFRRTGSSVWFLGTSGGIIIVLLLATASYLAFSKRFTESEPPRDQKLLAQALLLRELSVMERVGQDLLGEGHRTSVIRLRERLLELGIWNKGDAYNFDIALRTRNEIAHGDQGGVSIASVAAAVETMKRLREKVEQAEMHEER
jgi:hypothetical protein